MNIKIYQIVKEKITNEKHKTLSKIIENRNDPHTKFYKLKKFPKILKL